MDATDIILRLIGAFYAFAGYVVTRAGLTSIFIDRAIAAIALQKPKPIETAKAIWHLTAATLVLVSGVTLLLLLDLAALAFTASAIGQAAYLFVLGPRVFDLHDPPDPRGRRQSTNAFVIYSAATTFVLWAAYTERLLTWRDVPWPVLALAGAGIIGHIGHVIWTLTKAPGASRPPLFGNFDDGADDRVDVIARRSQSKRIKVMADYECHPLWALDEDIYGDFPPSELDLSPELIRELDDWADRYTASFDRDNPSQSLWSETKHQIHAAEGRSLAVRLARERRDLMIYSFDGQTGVVEVHADEPSERSPD